MCICTDSHWKLFLNYWGRRVYRLLLWPRGTSKRLDQFSSPLARKGKKRRYCDVLYIILLVEYQKDRDLNTQWLEQYSKYIFLHVRVWTGSAKLHPGPFVSIFYQLQHPALTLIVPEGCSTSHHHTHIPVRKKRERGRGGHTWSWFFFNFYFLILKLFFAIPCSMWDHSSPNSSPYPLQCKCIFLITGHPGKSHDFYFF